MKVTVSEDDLWAGNVGVCISCGEFASDGVEPDARKYHCEACGQDTVYGLEEALLMGFIDIDIDE